MTPWVELVAGALVLYFGAEWFVGGASRLALAIRIPQLIVGLTVVAYGTSAPEIIVGVQAGIAGHPEVALGNVLGSNIANIGLILGISALIRPPVIDGALARREMPMLVGSAFLVPLALWDGLISRWEGGLLLVGATVYTAAMVRGARSAAVRREASESAGVTASAATEAGAPASHSVWRSSGIAAGGLLVLLVGGNVFLNGAVSIASRLGMGDRLVGLTIVAIGTSLPELITSVIAAVRGHSDIGVGNVIGSNIFNVLLCMGAAAVASPIQVRLGAVAADVGVLLGMTLLAGLFIRTARTLRRWEGAALLVLYAAYTGYLILSA